MPDDGDETPRKRNPSNVKDGDDGYDDRYEYGYGTYGYEYRDRDRNRDRNRNRDEQENHSMNKKNTIGEDVFIDTAKHKTRIKRKTKTKGKQKVERNDPRNDTTGTITDDQHQDHDDSDGDIDGDKINDNNDSNGNILVVPVVNTHPGSNDKDDDNDNDKNTKKNSQWGGRQSYSYASKRKRNGRVVRLVSLGNNDDTATSASKSASASTTARDEATLATTGKTTPATPTTTTTPTTSVPPLPTNQYATTLRRRAVRKLEHNAASASQDNSNSDNNNEYGDISLGIKLIVAGGKVIVQSLNALNDGWASPAKLTGVVQRGDVLLAIGNRSLTNLPIDKLVEGLALLSTSDCAWRYQRYLDLRLEPGAGMDLLKSHKQDHGHAPAAPAPYRTMRVKCDRDASDVLEEAKDTFPGDEKKKIVDNEEMVNYKFNARNLDSLISATLARERNSDRERHESEFLYRREDFSELLRRTIAQVKVSTSDDRDQKQINNNNNPSTNKERLELGHKIIETVRALELNLEEIDKGRQSLNKNNQSLGISLRSGALSATVKCRYNTKDRTITSHRVFNCENNIDEGSIGSDDGGHPLLDNSDNDGDHDDYVGVVDPDKLLLDLADQSAIWRKQVVSMLNKAIDDNSGEEKCNNNNNGGRGLDLTKRLGYFLFREDLPGSPKQGTKLSSSSSSLPSISFPPPEITRVIFDLTTYIAASAATSSDDFTAFGATLGSKLSSNTSSFQSSGTTTTTAKTGAGMGRSSL